MVRQRANGRSRVAFRTDFERIFNLFLAIAVLDAPFLWRSTFAFFACSVVNLACRCIKRELFGLAASGWLRKLVLATEHGVRARLERNTVRNADRLRGAVLPAVVSSASVGAGQTSIQVRGICPLAANRNTIQSS